MRILASKSRDPPTGPRFHSLSYMGKGKKRNGNRVEPPRPRRELDPPSWLVLMYDRSCANHSHPLPYVFVHSGHLPGLQGIRLSSIPCDRDQGVGGGGQKRVPKGRLSLANTSLWILEGCAGILQVLSLDDG